MARGLVGTGNGQEEIFDVRIGFTYLASKMQTGFSLRRGAAELATLQDVANNVDTTLRPVFVPLIPTTGSYLGVDVVNVTTKEGASVSPAGVAGTMAPVFGPGFITAVASMKGELRTRYGQGRMHLPCLNEGWYDQETLNATGTAALQAFVDAVNTEYGTPGAGQEFILVNWHPALPAGRPNGTRPDVPAVASSWYDVTSIRLNTQVSMLRSRKQGNGS